MQRKISNVLINQYGKLKEFRGIPINQPKDKKLTWVYGGLKIVDEYFNGSNGNRHAYIIQYQERYPTMQFYNEVEIKLETLGQKLGIKGLYEGDVIISKKYPELLFECCWDRLKVGWVIKKIFGGKDSTEIYSQDINDYETTGNWVGEYDWYYLEEPVSLLNDDLHHIFIKHIEDKDIWFNYLTKTIKINKIVNRACVSVEEYDIDGIAMYFPEILENLFKRQFV